MAMNEQLGANEMSQISNDAEFKQALNSLNVTQQRILAAKFVEHVLALSNDKRLKQVVHAAMEEDASQHELSMVQKLAMAATVDHHARCGADGNWTEQAGYFVGRAAIAALSKAPSSTTNPAWIAAMSCRMALTSATIDDEGSAVSTHSEVDWQYQLLPQFINS